MKIKELKELLKKYPDDLAVVIDGHEGGYDDLFRERIFPIKIVRDVNCEDDAPKNPNTKKETVLLLSNSNRCY